MSHAEVAQFEQVTHKIDPQSKLLAVWELKGGISAQMTALEVARADGQRRKLIVRRPGAATLRRNPQAAAHEFRILQLVQAAGVKAQRPYLLDTSGTILPDPYLVIEYVEGEPEYAPADPVAFARQIATQLARLHSIDSTALDLAFLPQQAPRLNQIIAAPPAQLDSSLAEGRIRARLEEVWPLPAGNRPVMLHGDFWPGNLLWQAGALAAVIDWEDAEVGNPLFDVAITRLDMLWLFGPAALDAFTQQYQALNPLDFRQLPDWDLLAALRPAGRLAEWAAGWPDLGRSDISEATMRAWHQHFVAQAFAVIDGGDDGER